MEDALEFSRLHLPSYASPKQVAAGGMPEPRDSLLLDLAYPFSGELVLAAEFLQRHGLLPVQPIAALDDLGFPLREGSQNGVDVGAEYVLDSHLLRISLGLVLDKVPKKGEIRLRVDGRVQ